MPGRKHPGPRARPRARSQGEKEKGTTEGATEGAAAATAARTPVARPGVGPEGEAAATAAAGPGFLKPSCAPFLVKQRPPPAQATAPPPAAGTARPRAAAPPKREEEQGREPRGATGHDTPRPRVVLRAGGRRTLAPGALHSHTEPAAPGGRGARRRYPARRHAHPQTGNKDGPAPHTPARAARGALAPTRSAPRAPQGAPLTTTWWGGSDDAHPALAHRGLPAAERVTTPCVSPPPGAWGATAAHLPARPGTGCWPR